MDADGIGAANADGDSNDRAVARPAENAPRVHLLRRIFEHPETLAPMLNGFLERITAAGYLRQHTRDVLAFAIALNEPWLNVMCALMFIDTVTPIRQHMLAHDPSEFNDKYLVFMHEKMTHLLSSNFTAENAEELLVQDASALSSVYTMRNTVVVDHVVYDVRRGRSFDTLGYAPALTAETIGAARRARESGAALLGDEEDGDDGDEGGEGDEMT